MGDKNEIIEKLNKTEFENENVNKEKQEMINILKFELMELKNRQDGFKNEKHKICEESEDLKSYYEQINLNNQETIDKLEKQLNIYKKECDVDKNEIIEKLNKTEFEKDNINKEKQEIINKLKYELMELKNKQDEIKNEKHKICEESEDLKS